SIPSIRVWHARFIFTTLTEKSSIRSRFIKRRCAMAVNLTPQARLEDRIPAGFPAAVTAESTTRPAAYRRVYVWEWPVRVFHWVNALTIVLLAATGYVIGNPQSIFGANEPYQQNW